MRKVFGKTNDSGSALIIVIIAMLFVGIIASIVVSIAMGNLDIIGTGVKASDNFYTAENVIDELKTNLKAKADEAAVESYSRWLQHYVFMDEENRNLAFKSDFADTFIDTLNNYFGPTAVSGGYTNLLYTYKESANISINPNTRIEKEEVKKLNTETGEEKVVDYKVVIKNISITYTDPETNHVSTITTDLEFSIDKPTLKINTSTGAYSKITEYALIADKTVANYGPSITTGTVNVIGSVYGGGKTPTGYDGYGIDISGGSAMLRSNAVVSRSTVRVSDNATLTIKGRNSMYDGRNGKYYYATVWANNLLLGKRLNETKSIMDLQAQCYIADDLTIDTDYSSVTLTGSDSEYYGYNTNNRTSRAETSSSIVINGENVSLDLSAAKQLWLAGKSFVSVPNDKIGTVSNNRSVYQQGESLVYRSLQSAYLLPGECILGVLHNPITAEEYVKIKNGVTGYGVDIGQSQSHGGINLTRYLDSASPYTFQIVKYGDATDDYLVYAYMNFISPDHAAEYFQDYYRNNNDLVNSKMQIFKANESNSANVGKIRINTSTLTTNANGETVLSRTKVVNTGNIVTFEQDNDEVEVKFIYSNADYFEKAIVDKQSDLSRKFSCITTSLDASSPGDDQDLTLNIVNWARVDELSETFLVEDLVRDKKDALTGTFPEIYVGIDGTTDLRQAKLIRSKGNYSITSNTAGIILAEGDVTVGAGVSFWGTIIAQGNIYLGSGSSVNAGTRICWYEGEGASRELQSESVATLLQTHSKVKPYFSFGDDDGGDPTNELSSVINIDFVNWKKE